MVMGGKIINIFFLLILIVIGLIIRILYMLPPATLEGDTAVFGLMAKYIYELKEFPIYMWRAHYGGTLASYIGAFLFKLFGISSITFNAVGVIFSCLWVLFTFMLARQMLDYSGSIYSLTLVLLPPLHVLSFSLCTGSINPETLLFGSLSFLFLIKLNSDYQRGYLYYFLFGSISGMGLWLTPAMVPFLLTILTVFSIQDRKIFLSKRFLFWVIGFFAGYIPAIIYNFQNPWATFFGMAGRILDVDRGILSSPNLTKVIISRILWRISTVPISLIKIPFLLFALLGIINSAIFFIAIFWVCKNGFLNFLKSKKIKSTETLIIYIFWVIAFHSVLVGKESIRYLVPLYAVFPLLVGKLLSDVKVRSGSISLVLLFVLLSYNGYGNINAFLNRKIHHYPELAKWLLSKKLFYGYSDYWTAYPVVFEANEQVLISPTLFHPTFSDRRPEYTAKIREAMSVVYILPLDMYPEEITKIEKRFKMLNISYKKDMFKEFIIYYNFSRKIYPEELNLTWN
jgi:hypothetical protein